jgi:hypothetical protein
MLTAAVHSKMRLAANDVLGMMFMSPVLTGTTFPPAGWVDPIIVGLDFSGTRMHGTCALAMEEQTARNLASVFLCPDEATPVSRTSAWEVMCELSNMLCGKLLSQIDQQESYSLSSPRSMLPGEMGLMQPLHRNTLQTKLGAVLFIVSINADKRN